MRAALRLVYYSPTNVILEKTPRKEHTMAFGPMMTVTTKRGLELELAPFARDELRPFVDGFAHGTARSILPSTGRRRSRPSKHGTTRQSQTKKVSSGVSGLRMAKRGG